jgi:hypothetical protein
VKEHRDLLQAGRLEKALGKGEVSPKGKGVVEGNSQCYSLGSSGNLSDTSEVGGKRVRWTVSEVKMEGF